MAGPAQPGGAHFISQLGREAERWREKQLEVEMVLVVSRFGITRAVTDFFVAPHQAIEFWGKVDL